MVWVCNNPDCDNETDFEQIVTESWEVRGYVDNRCRRNLDEEGNCFDSEAIDYGDPYDLEDHDYLEILDEDPVVCSSCHTEAEWVNDPNEEDDDSDPGVVEANGQEFI